MYKYHFPLNDLCTVKSINAILTKINLIYGQFSKGGYKTHITNCSLKNKKKSFSLMSNFVSTESFSSFETGNDAFYYKNVV